MDQSLDLGWIRILALMFFSGAFGGILDVLQIIDIRRLIEQSGPVVASRTRFAMALVLGGIIGSGGAYAMLFFIAATNKLKTTGSADNILYLGTLGMVSGFLGYRLLKGVAARVEKQINESELRTSEKLKDTENRLATDVELVEALTEGLAALSNPKNPPSSNSQTAEKLERVRKRLTDNRKLAIVTARMHSEKFKDYKAAIEILTECLKSKEAKGTGKDEDAADILYNRACYYNLLADKLKQDDPARGELKEKTYRDLEQSIALSPQNKTDAPGEDELASLWNEERFKKLTQ